MRDKCTLFSTQLYIGCMVQQKCTDRPWAPIANLNWSSSASAAAFRLRGTLAPASPSRPPGLAPSPALRPSEEVTPSQAELEPAAVLRVRCATRRSAATCRAAALCFLSCLGSKFTYMNVPAKSLQSQTCQQAGLHGLHVNQQLAARHAGTAQCSTSEVSRGCTPSGIVSLVVAALSRCCMGRSSTEQVH